MVSTGMHGRPCAVPGPRVAEQRDRGSGRARAARVPAALPGDTHPRAAHAGPGELDSGPRVDSSRLQSNLQTTQGNPPCSLCRHPTSSTRRSITRPSLPSIETP